METDEDILFGIVLKDNSSPGIGTNNKIISIATNQAEWKNRSHNPKSICQKNALEFSGFIKPEQLEAVSATCHNLLGFRSRKVSKNSRGDSLRLLKRERIEMNTSHVRKYQGG